MTAAGYSRSGKVAAGADLHHRPPLSRTCRRRRPSGDEVQKDVTELIKRDISTTERNGVPEPGNSSEGRRPLGRRAGKSKIEAFGWHRCKP